MLARVHWTELRKPLAQTRVPLVSCPFLPRFARVQRLTRLVWVPRFRNQTRFEENQALDVGLKLAAYEIY